MSAAIVAFLLCILNVVLWIILFIKFKDIFSTKKTLEETHEALNSMLISINRNADRNITLLEEKIKEIKSVTEEAEKRISFMKFEISRNQKAKEFKSLLENAEPVSETAKNGETEEDVSPLPDVSVFMEKEFKEQEPKNSVLMSNDENEIPVIKKQSPVMMYQAELGKGRLYHSEVPGKSDVMDNRKSISVESSGIPGIVESQNKIILKKNLKERVNELSQYGFSIEEIAAKLGRSTQEIEFSLEF